MARNRLSTNELLERFTENPVKIARAAEERKISLSSYCEMLSPTKEEGELDAIGRMLQQEGLRTKSDVTSRYSASPVIDFLNTPARRMLLIEVLNRAYREIALRAPMLSSDMEQGATLRPFVDGTARFDRMVAPVVPLSEIVATTTQISGQDYRTLVFDYDDDAFTEERTPELQDLPLARMTQSEEVIPLLKRGVRLQVSYEFMRRSQLHVDKLALQVQKIAVHRELTKVKLGVKTMRLGDGNPGTAATVHGLYELDPRADGYPGSGAIIATENVSKASSKVKFTLKSWLAFKKKFQNPYTITTILMNESMATNLELLDLGTTNTPLVEIQNLAQRLTYGQLRPINLTADGIRYGWLDADTIPDNQILAFDNRFALEHITEIGSDISEMDRFIRNQSEELTLSENYGMGIMDHEACRILDASPSQFVTDLDADENAEGGSAAPSASTGRRSNATRT